MRFISILSTYTAVLIFFSSCSNHSAEDLPDYIQSLENVTVHIIESQPDLSIKLTQLTAFGNIEDVPFGRISYVDIDDSGNVYISEGSQGNEAVYVFDSEGNYLNKIGRSGEGPGEFRSIDDMKVFNDKLLVLDGNLLRIQFFSTDDHSLIDEASLNPSEWDQSGEQSATFPENIFVLNDSTLLTSFYHLTFDVDSKSYYHLNLEGDVISDQILTHDFIKHLNDPSSSYVFYDPFGGRGLIEISSTNEIYSVWSDKMLFKVYDADGTYLRAFYHPFRNSSISRNEALSFSESEQFKSALRHHGIPDYWRAFEHLILDSENRIWVSTISENQEIYNWWVMDNHGKVLTKKELPRTMEIKKVKNDILYSLISDEESGLQQVVSFEIEWES